MNQGRSTIMPERMETLRDLSLMLSRIFDDERICRDYFKMWGFWSVRDETRYASELENYTRRLSMLLDRHVFTIREIVGLFGVEPFSNVENLSSEEIKNIYDLLNNFRRLGVFDHDVAAVLKLINAKMEDVNSWRISRADYNMIIEDLKYIFDGDELKPEALMDVDASLQEFIDNNRERYENCVETVNHINEIVGDARKVIYDVRNRRKEEIFESYFDQNADLWQDVTAAYNDLDHDRLGELESHVSETVKKIL
jgi:predicted house-cleaning noncanonical NTP pyrophosphatase (MazG superfamily)